MGRVGEDLRIIRQRTPFTTGQIWRLLSSGATLRKVVHLATTHIYFHTYMYSKSLLSSRLKTLKASNEMRGEPLQNEVNSCQSLTSSSVAGTP
jgi:hypothetical protein